MRVILLCLLLAGCSQTDVYYDPKPKTDIPDLPSVRGAGKLVEIPKGELTDEQKDLTIIALRKSEKANAEGYIARGRAFTKFKRIYNGEQP